MIREIVPKRKIRYPMGLERDYAKLLTAYVARKMKVASAFIPEMKAALQTSNMTGHINLVLDQMEQAMESADVMTRTMQKMARLVEDHTEKETDAEFRSVFSLSAPLLPGLLKNQPVTDIGRQDAAFPDLEELKQAWVDQNLDLIRSIDRQTLERIKQQLNDAIIYNSDAAALTKFLAEAIQEIAHNETSRAVLIATDQIGKLHGRMSQYRQEQAGITHYIWETAHDSRVRPWHRTRQGKKFAWSNPPPDGHPGIPIRCRCVALPVIDLEKIPIRVKPSSFYKIGSVSQAKKRDHKVFITDVAIDKVPCVKTREMSEAEALSIQGEHKALLKVAQRQNGSDEVLTVMSLLSGRRVRTLGTEKYVNPSSNPEAVGLMRTSARNEIVYLHNHPSTNRFSMTDIYTFLLYAQIGVMSIVTNQGEVYILHKTRKYDYNKAREIFDTIYMAYLANKVSHNEAVARFLKEAAKGGIEYGKSR